MLPVMLYLVLLMVIMGWRKSLLVTTSVSDSYGFCLYSGLFATETQPKHNRPQICWPLGMWMQMTSEIYYLYQMYLLFSVLMFRQLLIGLWKICWTNDLSPSAYQLVLFMAFLSTNWRKINSKWGHSLLISTLCPYLKINFVVCVYYLSVYLFIYLIYISNIIPGGAKKRPEHLHGVMQQSSRNE